MNKKIKKAALGAKMYDPYDFSEYQKKLDEYARQQNLSKAEFGDKLDPYGEPLTYKDGNFRVSKITGKKEMSPDYNPNGALQRYDFAFSPAMRKGLAEGEAMSRKDPSISQSTSNYSNLAQDGASNSGPSAAGESPYGSETKKAGGKGMYNGEAAINMGTVLQTSIAAINALYPDQTESKKRIIPQAYNPNQYGTGSQAIYANGGEVQGNHAPIQPMWGGNVKQISENDYSNPMVEFNGKTHKEGGIGIDYAGQKVEVEHDEAGFVDREGALNIFGKLNVPGTNKKFKTVAKEIADRESKVDKTKYKALNTINNTDPTDPYNGTAFNTAKVMFHSSDNESKQISMKKEQLADLQNTMLNMIGEDQQNNQKDMGGKIPIAKKGWRYKGTKLDGEDPKILEFVKMLEEKGYSGESGPNSGVSQRMTKSGNKSRHMKGEALDMFFDVGKDSYDKILGDSDLTNYLVKNNLTVLNEYDPEVGKKTGATAGHLHVGYDKGTGISEQFRTDARKRYPNWDWDELAGPTKAQAYAPKSAPANIDPRIKAEYDKAQKTRKPADILAFQTKFHQVYPDAARSIVGSDPVTSYGQQEKLGNTDLKSNEDGIWGKRTQQYMAYLNSPKGAAPTDTDVPGRTPTGSLKNSEDDRSVGKQGDMGMTSSNAQPVGSVDIGNTNGNKRPSNKSRMNPANLVGEMFTLATSRQEPVDHFTYEPTLYTPYSVSFQDKLNENNATFNSIERQLPNNASALATLAAQKYTADNNVLSEEFRTNQGIANDVTNKNVGILNQAAQTNLQLDMDQSNKQAQAKFNTRKEMAAALGSMSTKYAKNDLENKTLAAYENLYKFRFDKDGNAVNYNDPAVFTGAVTGPQSGISQPDKVMEKVNSKGETSTTTITNADGDLEDLLKAREYLKKGGRREDVLKAMPHLNGYTL